MQSCSWVAAAESASGVAEMGSTELGLLWQRVGGADQAEAVSGAEGEDGGDVCVQTRKRAAQTLRRQQGWIGLWPAKAPRGTERRGFAVTPHGVDARWAGRRFDRTRRGWRRPVRRQWEGGRAALRTRRRCRRWNGGRQRSARGRDQG